MRSRGRSDSTEVVRQRKGGYSLSEGALRRRISREALLSWRFCAHARTIATELCSNQDICVNEIDPADAQQGKAGKLHRLGNTTGNGVQRRTTTGRGEEAGGSDNDRIAFPGVAEPGGGPLADLARR